MSEIVIFGASEGGIKTYKMLNSIGVKCRYFIDNAEKKWGRFVENVEVTSPKYLSENDCDIVISSVYYEEIVSQLKKMGIDKKRIVPREKYVAEYINRRMNQYCKMFGNIKRQPQKEIVIDLDHGLQVGGIESWAYSVARASVMENIPIMIYTKLGEAECPYHLDKYTKRWNVSRENFEEEILNIVKDMMQHLPCLFIADWMEQSFWAAYILKCIHPDDVFILGMVHHDMEIYYRRNQYIANLVNAFMCISGGTKKKMVEEYQIPCNRVFYKEVPIETINTKRHTNQIFTIGVGARLDKAKKRVDLLIPLIEKLEQLQTQYRFWIAGDGNFYQTLKTYIENNGLSDKVKLLGELKTEKMAGFWRSIDAVVSTSDSEGMGLSILEGMANGAVPVVTNTAGIKEYVEDNKNGYIVEIYDMETLAFRLDSLSKDRDRVKKFSKNAIEMIQEKCSLHGYIQYMVENNIY